MRHFLKQTFASLIGTLAGLILFVSLGTGGLVLLLIAAASKDTGPQVRNKSVLVFDLGLNITDSDPSRSTSEALGDVLSGDDGDTISLRTVLDAIDKATQDKRIVGIYLDGTKASAGGAGFATLKEVREALERFRASGKKILAYNMGWGKQEYYVGSVANTVVVNPLGEMELNGLRSEPMFLAGALEKYGIGVQVIRVGKYKSAVEPYVLKQLSKESKQQTQKLLSDIWGEFKATVGKSRKITPKQLQAIADTSAVLSATEAKKRGLVDKVAYFDEVVAELKKLTGNKKEDESFRKISLTTYADISGESLREERNSENKVAVIYAEGEIVDGQGGASQIGGDGFARQLRKLRLNNDVKAVVLRVNSPGGSAAASEVIQREVRLTKQVKPVVVSMGDMAASGGYWISTYGNRIFAEPNTITGSIGVFGLLLNVKKLANNQGITWDVVKTSKYADSQTISRPKTPEELAVNQRFVNQIYYQFINKVADSRKLPKQKVAEIAQGRVWSGKDAKRLGLVDEIGGLDSAIAYAAKEAKLGDDWELQQYPEKRSLEERILKKLSGDQASVKQKKLDPLTAEFLKLQAELTTLKAMNDPMNVYARMPYNLRID
ncbi:signal peptide peptidase SppA [Microcoleus sp. FACHB-831]|uniref:signal peptide peptidase SppA n=1 Tax=Microcoleus sp. FACHB-831 TaxID=2692827 RepID=UPI001684EF08|nr:signal peptide peptidase SppA [Microcoleus sp. FACHB-831]MBD1919636.1 signal peptide peptidase SppA [Microcoleus sp. FACHB-831]